ncbi:hypothetical protein N9Y42_08815 [Mariniblastus sp.]|nr:hypothetical protein [Mariniblastus sp.]
MQVTRLYTVLLVFFFASATASAQVFDSGPSDAGLFTNVFDLPGDVLPDSKSVGGVAGETTQLNVADGGFLSSSFNDPFVAREGSEVNISGGSVGSRFEARGGSEVNISGGTTGSSFEAFANSLVNISGGTVETSFNAIEGSEVNISGGSIDVGFRAMGKVKISGGSIGSRFTAFESSDVELVGGEFKLNGEAFSDPTIALEPDDILWGVLADGSPFVFSPIAEDRFLSSLTLTVSSEPIPAASPVSIMLSTPTDAAPFGLRDGQTLTLRAGGQLNGGFTVIDGTLNVEGGLLEAEVKVIGGTVNISGGPGSSSSNFHRFRAFEGSVVNISEGSLGTSRLDAFNGSEININGGSIDSGLSAFSGSEVNISGGSVGRNFSARAGSIVNISGGNFDSGLSANSDSAVNISGGAIGRGFVVRSRSSVELIGGEFKLNGETYAGPSITIVTGDVLTATLADGSPFIFSGLLSDSHSGDLSLTLSSEPLPEASLVPMVVSTPIDTGPRGLRQGQSLTLRPGGILRSNSPIIGAMLNVEGGFVEDDLQSAGSIVNVSSGSIGRDFFAVAGSVVNISGGSVGDGLRSKDSSVVNISGGSAGFIDATDGGVVNVSGSSEVSELTVFRDGVVNISGGTIGFLNASADRGTANISGGSVAEFSAAFGAVVNLNGRNFVLNGVSLNDLNAGEAFTILDRDVTLSGLLADGTAFSFDLDRDTFPFRDPEGSATLTVTLTPEFLLGDCNQDGFVDFSDIAPFISVLASDGYLAEADTNEDGAVTFDDIGPFIVLLSL